MTGAPKVTISEQNQSFSTTTPTAYYAAVVLSAPKGQVNKAVFIASEAQLLSNYTPNKTIITGLDLGFFSALAYLQTGGVWIVRAALSALFGGVDLTRRGSTENNAQFDTGQSDMTEYSWPDGVNDAETLLAIYGLNQGNWNDNVGIQLFPYHAPDNIVATDFDFTGNTITTHVDVADTGAVLTQGPTWTTGEPIKFILKKAADILPSPLLANTTYYVVETNAPNVISLATSLLNALNGVTITMTSSGMNLSSGSSFTLSPVAPHYCKTPGCFDIWVYSRADKNSAPFQVETWTVSTMHIKDGYGNNVFIEDVLQGSAYISALLNVGITDGTPNDVYPKAVTGVVSGSIVVPLYLLGGDDGSDLTDDDYADYLPALANQDEVQVKFILDGGHTTPTYQAAILNLCETRKDCFGVLCVPYSAEAASDYVNSIVNYRKIDANFDSSYGAMYTPHIYAYDKYNDRLLYVSPDGYAAAIINLSGWLPPFGLNRGNIIVNGLRRILQNAEMDMIFDAGINPLRFIPGRGTFVWGDKTLVAVPSALDGINVRMVLSDVEPTVKNAMESFIGEIINDSSTQALVRTTLNNYLSQVKSLRGVKDWFVKCDASNNTAQDAQSHQLNVSIYFKPYLSIRYINVPFIITSQGVQFNQATVT